MEGSERPNKKQKHNGCFDPCDNYKKKSQKGKQRKLENQKFSRVEVTKILAVKPVYRTDDTNNQTLTKNECKVLSSINLTFCLYTEPFFVASPES